MLDPMEFFFKNLNEWGRLKVSYLDKTALINNISYEFNQILRNVHVCPC